MDTDNIFRRLRGAVGNAMVWGAGWAACALVTFAGLKITGILSPSVIWLDSILVAARFGLMGGIVGGAFSLVIGLLYRGRRLADINWVRFGLRGGIMAGLFVPTFMTAARLLSGDTFLPLENLLTNGLMSAAFGGVAAGVSLKLAQRANPLLSGGSQDRPGVLGSGDPLASMGAWDTARRTAPAGRGAAH
jgi:hypothetical protein